MKILIKLKLIKRLSFTIILKTIFFQACIKLIKLVILANLTEKKTYLLTRGI